MRVLVFGDSITQGYFDSRGGWCDRVKGYYMFRDARQHHYYESPELFNLGIGGDTVAGLLHRFDREVSARRWQDGPVGFMIAIGINDSVFSHGAAKVSIETFSEQLAQLHELLAVRKEPVIVVGLTPVIEDHPDMNDPGFEYSNDRISEFDAALQKFCNQYDLPYVELASHFLGHEAELLVDGLHPNDAGHALIAELVQQQLDKFLMA